MKNKRGFALLLGCFVLANEGAQAQSPELCGQILKYGVWESRDVSDRMFERQDVANWACSQSSQNGGGGLSIPGILDATGNKNSTSNACNNSQAGYQLSRDYREAIRRAAPEIVRAWQGCIESYGSNASLIFRPDPRQFTIVLNHRPRSNLARIETLQNIQCNGGLASLRRGIRVENQVTISCTRGNPYEAVSIDVQFDGGFGARSLYIPAEAAPQKVPTIDDIKRELVGQYQVVLGPRGGCNGGGANTRPGNLARIERDTAGGLRALNECGNPTPVTVNSATELSFYNERARIDRSDGLKLLADDQNQWWKVP